MSLIQFNEAELKKYSKMGAERCASALARQRKGAHGFNRDNERWQIDVEGVLAEAAVAKALGVEYKATVDALDTKAGDIPGLSTPLQVRSTKYTSGSLLIHHKDDDDHRFVLVTGIYGTYEIRGWIFAKFGKHDKLWRQYKGRGAFWVPQDMLHPWDAAEVGGWL